MASACFFVAFHNQWRAGGSQSCGFARPRSPWYVRDSRIPERGAGLADVCLLWDWLRPNKRSEEAHESERRAVVVLCLTVCVWKM